MTKTVELDRRAGKRLLNEAAKRHLGMTGTEFLRKYDAGQLPKDDFNVLEVSMLIPFARQ